MKLKLITDDVTIPHRKLLSVTVLVSSTLAWFFVFYYYFNDIFVTFTNDLFWVSLSNVLFLVFIAVSAIVGSMIAEKVDRRKFLVTWTLLGILTTTLLLFFHGAAFSVISSILLGISFGLGLPSSWSYLADSTTVEERARVSGIVILTTFILVIMAVIAGSALGIGLAGIIIVCITIKIAGSLSFFLDSCHREKTEAKPWREILGYRDFTFYLLAYILFNAANGLVTVVWNQIQLTPDYSWAFEAGTALHYVGVGAFALIAGLTADRIGRKKPIIVALVLLGVGYAFVGLATSPPTLFIHMLISGFAWGFLMVVYLAVPGDLSFAGSRERFYALGAVIPIIIYAGFTGVASLLSVINPPISLPYFSSILSIVLFVSVLPVLYASETLPDAKVRARKFKEYAEKIGKIVKESQSHE